VDVIVALVFIGIVLVAAALAFFRSRLSEGDFDHGERLSLLPLQDDDGRSVDARTVAGTKKTVVPQRGQPDRPPAVKEEEPADGNR
jgi:hypothetical protein